MHSRSMLRLNEDVTFIHLHHFGVVYLCLFQFGLQVDKFLLHLTNLQRNIVKMSYIKVG